MNEISQRDGSDGKKGEKWTVTGQCCIHGYFDILAAVVLKW